MTQRDPPHEVARILAVADVLDPQIMRKTEINDADKRLAVLVLRGWASKQMKAADAGRPVRP